MQTRNPLPAVSAAIALLMAFSVFFSSSVYAQSSIFGGGSSGSGGGIFGGISQGVQSFFNGLTSGVPGGAVIPGITPSAGPGPVVPPSDSLPPLERGSKQIKLSLEWDAVSVGGEAVRPEREDPLRSEHLQFIQQHGCPPESACPARLTPAPEHEGETWHYCVEQGGCVAGHPTFASQITHGLYGWCGHQPTVISAGVPGSNARAYEGPNSYTLPGAVSNKYIRRDGYVYGCMRACEGGTCRVDNYMEFQTSIYHSNAISMYVKVENISSVPVNDVIVRVGSGDITSTSGDTTNLPYNLDYPISGRGTGSEYVHGDNLGEVWFIRYTRDGVPYGVKDEQIYYGPFNLNAGETRYFPVQDDDSEVDEVPSGMSMSVGSTMDNLAGGVDSLIGGITDWFKKNTIIGKVVPDIVQAQASIDMLDYYLPDSPVTVGMSSGEHFSVVPTKVNGQDGFVLVKNQEGNVCEHFNYDGQNMYHLRDTSWATGFNQNVHCSTGEEASFTYVKGRLSQSDACASIGTTGEGSGWTQRFMDIGEEVVREFTVVGISKTTNQCCDAPYTGPVTGSIKLVEVLDEWQGGDGGVVFQDVAHLEITSGPGAGEHFYLAKGIGKVGWGNASGDMSYATALFDGSLTPSGFCLPGLTDVPASDPPDFGDPAVIGQPGNPNIPGFPPEVENGTGVDAGQVLDPIELAKPLGKGGIVPRDFNFICDDDDDDDEDRCDGAGLPDYIISHGSDNFDKYRDVTGIGGCGYRASSDNSIVGPLQIVAEYGGEIDAQTSRSVLIASIPIGGRIIDTESRPFGWPVSGDIEQNWGFTGEAAGQGSYRSNPSREFGEYRYCE